MVNTASIDALSRFAMETESAATGLATARVPRLNETAKKETTRENNMLSELLEERAGM